MHNCHTHTPVPAMEKEDCMEKYTVRLVDQETEKTYQLGSYTFHTGLQEPYCQVLEIQIQIRTSQLNPVGNLRWSLADRVQAERIDVIRIKTALYNIEEGVITLRATLPNNIKTALSDAQQTTIIVVQSPPISPAGHHLH
jgi:hypothetical protein